MQPLETGLKERQLNIQRDPKIFCPGSARAEVISANPEAKVNRIEGFNCGTMPAIYNPKIGLIGGGNLVDGKVPVDSVTIIGIEKHVSVKLYIAMNTWAVFGIL
ncbi:hypothetical protein CAPTEDRAFT_200021 [Capitella teleta]|uniref:Uncharacterized protein n=1 Tax=Capitella teleta TaxID=283909 RepID=R7UZG8_CAPTE|nr:hypothetical protein CAPTEDRAFT_200021 [Capitella teleta]|eukprot:ELU08831.1 hypothetical protein CAPTEDRAFT_200021 [Capitella teleta]